MLDGLRHSVHLHGTSSNVAWMRTGERWKVGCLRVGGRKESLSDWASEESDVWTCCPVVM